MVQERHYPAQCAPPWSRSVTTLLYLHLRGPGASLPCPTTSSPVQERHYPALPPPPPSRRGSYAASTPPAATKPVSCTCSWSVVYPGVHYPALYYLALPCPGYTASSRPRMLTSVLPVSRMSQLRANPGSCRTTSYCRGTYRRHPFHCWSFLTCHSGFPALKTRYPRDTRFTVGHSWSSSGVALKA